jgi:hypothetical protein
MDLDEKELEFEMLLGMPASPLLYALKEEGFITRFYVPTGRFEESIKYFMRRLEENASSSSCQKHYKDYQRGKISEDEYLKLVFSPVEPNPPVAVVGV